MTKKQIVERKNFKKKVEYHLSRDLIYFYMAALSKKYEKIHLASFWADDVRRSYCSIITEIIRATKNSVDQRKEFSKIVARVKNIDASCRLCAEIIMKTSYGLIDIEYQITDRDTTKFWRIIDRDIGIDSIIKGSIMIKNKESVKRITQRLILMMARNRHEYIDKIQDPLNGALEHFYQVQLAKKNGQTTLVNHWMNEVNRLLNHDLKNHIKHTIKGFIDRRKAIDTAISEVQHDDKSFRYRAEYIIKKDYGMSKIKIPLNNNDTAKFWDLVDKVIERSLKSIQPRKS
jgi:hypothetical protein